MNILEFRKLIKNLGLSAFQIKAAQILLRVNGRESMMEYLDGIAKEKESKDGND